MDLRDDDIVISGIAGRYPECDSFKEFKEALLNGTDMVTEDSRRWEPGTYGTPTRAGKLNNIEYFDAGYFGISPRQADVMDPRHRVMFETVFETLVDSGYNPKELRGSKTGVYAGIGSFDNTSAYKDLEKTYGYAIIGCCLAQMANRTSYCFDFRGPSFALETACSSGLYAFAHAVKAMENGDIDSAIVSAVNINLHPHEAKEFNLLNMLSKDGKCKVFGIGRDGYARSEAIITLFLQRKSKCRRFYSTVLGSEINCDGWKLEGITFPSSTAQLELMDCVYAKYKLNPDDVTYVEMHGTGTPAGDYNECKSIEDFFCKNRKEPLPVGAVKSNMGHPEVSAGLCSLSKVIAAMESGIIPANLHCEDLDYSLPGINSGKLKVVTKNLPWNGGMVSINCFGFGGANAHLVLKSNDICKKKPRKMNYRLINVSGRTEESVQYYLEGVRKREDDQEFLALIDEIHKMDVDGHPFRGYAVLGDNPISAIQRISRKKRPIWFIYSGMGSQWTGMGKDFMKLDIFRNTIKRCAVALEPYNIDLEHIITTDDSTVFDDITNCFSGIAAVEIALTEIVKAFGIEPDGFAGHSLGEVGCAYCNGELTPEQAILLGFARGYASKRSNSSGGQMATIGLGKNEISKLLPEGVYIACINGKSNVTISGRPEPVKEFVETINKNGIFARLVPTAGYAFHSKYVNDGAPYLQEFIAKVLTDPKPRSKKWVSSSREEKDWSDPIAQVNSADYHCNNYKNPVLFDQVLSHVPKDAIIVEIAPHGLLTSLIKREMGPEATCLSLANKNSTDNMQFLLSNIGKLFINGGQPNLRKFYNDVSFPVGRGTYDVASMVKWDHSVKWYTPFFEANKSFGKKLTVNTGLEDYSYLKGHNIDGRVLMAATGYLELVWKVAAAIIAKSIEQVPVVFESIKFIRATVLPDGEDVEFFINIMKQSGYFEIFEGGSVCCSGTIKFPKRISDEFLNQNSPIPTTNGYKPLLKSDIYKWFHLKRYLYTGLFQGMESVDVTGTVGKLKWNGNFTSFLDTMLQVPLVPEYSLELFLPTRLQKVVIDPIRQLKESDLNNNEIPVYHDKDLKLIRSGGVEITNLEIFVAPKRQHIQADPILESYVFVPYITKNSLEAKNIELSLRIVLQIIIENNSAVKNLRLHEIVANKENSLIKIVEKISKTEPLLNITFVDAKSEKVDIILCSDSHFDRMAFSTLNTNAFIIFYGMEKDCSDLGLPIIYQNSFQEKGIYLLRNITAEESYVIIDINRDDVEWIEKLKKSLKEDQIVYVINRNDDYSGVIGLVKCLNLEPTERASIKCILLASEDAKRLPQDSDIFKKQLSNQLTINVLNKGVWGSYRHLPIKNIKPIDVPNACNYIQTIGDLSSFRWVEQSPYYQRLHRDAEAVYVYYAALNFKDVMTATGKLSLNNNDPSAPEVEAGFEFSGVTKSGKRVMGIAPFAISLQVLSDPLFTWDVPKSWSLKQAATVPVVYATCYYGIIMRGQLQKGESILIHAGAGGIGIAAISIALSMNCEIFTTVGSEEKRQFLLKLFPSLKPENIGNSRNTSFEQIVKKNTKGTGVDMVLNSLSADMFQASIRCIAQRGRFIEIGKIDLWAGTPVSASLFSKNTSFHGVLLDDLFTIKQCYAKQEINRLLTEGITKNVVRPLPTTVFTEDQVEEAYRFLSTGKHKGKVLIKIRDEDSAKSLKRTIIALPRIYFDPEKTYVLIGGLGGFGLELTNFLIKRCARKIVLNSRRGIINGYQSLCMKRWSEIPGLTVQINTDDTSTLEGAHSLVAFAEKLGPVGGIFNMALVLQDALFINQTSEKFDAVFKAKIYSGVNLDEVTRSQCPKLDHFVVFSSITSGRGNPGQSNYGMANSALERLCEKRREEGLPGLAVQYGPVGDVGAVAEKIIYEKTVSMYGLVFQTITSCINALETFMLQPYAIGSTFVIDEENTLSSSSGKSPVETVAHILGIKDIGLIDKNQPLTEMGLDSLMSTEIKQTLYRNFNIEIAAEDIRDLTFNKISQLCKNPASETVSVEVPITNGVKDANPVFNALLSEETIFKIINNKSHSNKLFFVPPIEGNIAVMIPLAEKLRANVYGLQFTKDMDSENIKEYANHFVKAIKNVQDKGPYFLCGYSYGGSLGFEIGVQLEELNEKVTLFLIDGTPSFVKQILEAKYQEHGKLVAQLRSNSLRAFLQTFENIDYGQTNALLDNSMSFEEQLKQVGEFSAKRTTYSAKHIVDSADRFVKRIAAGFYYQPTAIFKGKASLIRSDEVFKQIAEDYDLQKICEQPIDLEIIKGNHKEVLLGDNLDRISQLINNKLQ